VTVSVADRLFETLETTTRRATLDGREALVTDTVGFVDDLPHDLVASFSPTVEEVAAADAVVLAVDVSDPPATLRRKLATTLDVVEDAEAGVDPVVALTKADLVDEATLADRRELVGSVTDTTTVAVSAVDGAGLDRLVTAVRGRLPTERATVEMPAGDEAMAVVSRAYDRCRVLDVSYGDRVRVEVAGRPSVVAELRGAAEDGPAEE
ncbi:GTPase HflX, partial [Halobacteriales archaeon SW_7_71_33]